METITLNEDCKNFRNSARMILNSFYKGEDESLANRNNEKTSFTKYLLERRNLIPNPVNEITTKQNGRIGNKHDLLVTAA